MHIEALSAKVHERFASTIRQSQIAIGQLTIEIAPENIQEVCLALRDDADFAFDLLIDVCGVDYLQYGLSEWETQSATATGFERGVEVNVFKEPRKLPTPRFAAVYHLLSIKHNHRIRIRAFLEDDARPTIFSVFNIWPAANWFEREAFDLFGIMFVGHPDLRRILTDYGFAGHPFRKDFPLIGKVEVRYDAKLKSVVYDPVSIQPRVLEPKVIRDDNRYEVGK